MTHEEVEELVTRRVAEEMEAREAAINLEPLNDNGDEQEGGNRGNGNGSNRGNGNGGNGGNGNGGNGGNGNGGNRGNGNGGNGENRNGNRNVNHGMKYRGFMPVARECTFQDFLKCKPHNFSGTEGINSHKRTIGVDAAYAMNWAGLMRLMTEVYCPRNEIQKMETELWNLTMKENNLTAYTQRFQELILLSTRMVLDEEDRVERFIRELPDNIQRNVIAANPTRLQDAIRIANQLMDKKLQGYAARSAENKRRMEMWETGTCEERMSKVEKPELWELSWEQDWKSDYRSQLAIRGTLVNGEWISNPVGVKREFYSHFKNQFSPSYTPRLSFDFVFPNRLSTDQVEDLERLVTYDEVKRAVWDCGANKSPGPDGFTFEFFRKFWKTLDQDVFQAVSDFFENGHIPRGCNASFIALIPKIHDAKIVKDFRPISLIGSIYKIITKILANRLCNVLPCLISEVQSAFVSNRNILDGPFILDELLQWCKHKRKRAMIFKVDFEKAFDSVKWDYLIDTLRAFGFGQKWCSWINGCFETATGSVLVNGSPTSEFQFHRGLKQGDPISPFLFILIMETLHLSFKRVIEANLFKGISINASFSISHLFYADDVVFIGEWNSSNIKTVAKVLNCFYLASGLKINFHKSKLMGVGVNSNEVESVANLVGCSTFSSPFKYLGVIVGDNMSRLKPWEDVISKVSNRLSNWKLKTLSIGGRLTLIKSVISSIPLYHMSIFKAPMGVLNKLESIRRNFFNGIDGMDKKNSWIGWDKILASKKNGGLGVSSLYATNRALLFKWIWRFFSQDSSWWSRFIQAMHGNHGALSSCVTSLRRSPWLDIIREMHALNSKGIDLMQFLKKKLGNGENTSFWDDKWHDDGPFKSLYPRLHALETCKSISVASKLSQPSLIHSFRRPPRGGVEEEQFSLLGSRTTGISLPNMCDRWFWSLESSGDFSVKSTRICIDDNILPKNDVPTRWVKIIPIKVNIHAWKVFLDKIPTRLNLSLRGMDIPSILCPLCNSAAESTSHIFFSCPLARQVWNKFLRWWEMDSISFDRYEDWLSWLNNTRFPKQLKTFLEGICYIMWWLIWRFRNQVLFGSKQPRRDLLFDDIVQLSYLWISNRSPC
ncbi:RNA-directed DNA polymerase, eukaryota [Tanacetum coccineum]